MFDKIKESVQKFSRKNVADEEAVQELVKDIQRDLMKADVDVELVHQLSQDIKEEALKEDKPEGITRKEHVLETVYSQLEQILGEKAEINIQPQTILLAGLYGAGKTTTAAKLADFYRKRGLKTGLIAADTDRPAAHEQLKQLSEDAEAEFYGEKDSDDPEEIVKNGVREFEDKNVDVKIIDTAGRDSLDEELKQQIKDIEQAADTDEKYLVMPSDIGQNAKDQAIQFDEAIDITGVIITKIDASAKGGGAIVACETTSSPVKFVGTGEKLGDLEEYDPVDFVSDIIGQPDLESLLEKVEEMDTDPEELLEGEFTLEDFQQQMEQVTGSGMMEEMMEQLPIGGNKIPDNFSNMTEEKISSYNTIIDSMTSEEKQDPNLIDRSRTERIAQGSGQQPGEVKDLVQHFRQTKNMMDKFDKGAMRGGGQGQIKNMMNKLGL